MAVERLKYNDLGPVHSKIASGSVLEIINLLTQKVTPITVRNIILTRNTKVNFLCGSYLQDLGNSIHRIDHNIHSCTIANPILDRLFKEVYP